LTWVSKLRPIKKKAKDVDFQKHCSERDSPGLKRKKECKRQEKRTTVWCQRHGEESAEGGFMQHFVGKDRPGRVSAKRISGVLDKGGRAGKKIPSDQPPPMQKDGHSICNVEARARGGEGKKQPIREDDD